MSIRDFDLTNKNRGKNKWESLSQREAKTAVRNTGTMKLLTQRAAIGRLRTDFGLSIATATRVVKSMPTIPDGKRKKVLAEIVTKIGREMTTLPPLTEVKMRPISAKTLARIDRTKLKPMRAF